MARPQPQQRYRFYDQDGELVSVGFTTYPRVTKNALLADWPGGEFESVGERVPRTVAARWERKELIGMLIENEFEEDVVTGVWLMSGRRATEPIRLVVVAWGVRGSGIPTSYRLADSRRTLVSVLDVPPRHVGDGTLYEQLRRLGWPTVTQGEWEPA